MRSYLKNRLEIVVINKEQSDIMDISYGVPQGSIMGPLLFSLYINDLPDKAQNATVVMYADGTAVFFCHCDSSAIEYTLNDGMHIVKKWLDTHSLARVWLDERMSFTDHIQCVTAKISCKISLICRAKKYLSLDHSKMLFNATILPHFDYCSQV